MPLRPPLNLSTIPYFRNRTAFVESAFKNHTWKVLDVGNLGEGPINVDVRAIAAKNNGDYYGLDCNYNLAKAMGFEKQYVGDVHDMRGVIDDATFDCVYMGQVIEHSWRPAEVMRECYRVLKPEGYLILDTPNAFGLINLMRYLIKRKDTMGFDVIELTYQEAKDGLVGWRASGEKLSQPQHKIFYSPAMLRQLLNMHGFGIESFAFIGKAGNFVHRAALALFPQCSEKLGLVAKKQTLEQIFK